MNLACSSTDNHDGNILQTLGFSGTRTGSACSTLQMAYTSDGKLINKEYVQLVDTKDMQSMRAIAFPASRQTHPYI